MVRIHFSALHLSNVTLHSFSCISWLVVLLTANSLSAADAEQLAFFENNIRPLIVQRCLKCHGPQKSESGLRMDALSTLLKGGDSGPAVTPGQPDDSLIIKAVRHQEDLQMPPDEQLDEREIASLARWIQQGAAWPQGTMLGGSGPQVRGGAITDAERAFWSFQPLADPQPPRIDEGHVNSDIDRFVIAKLRAANLRPMPPADKRVLIRRATFDLTGLPPTPKDVQTFLDDDAPDAFDNVVDRLLESKAYGERWGRHWLDVVRYSDTAGETADYPTPLSYKYRNWVINAFNADMPYDQFVREQIAGDILAQQSPDVSHDQYKDMLTATGFIAISRRFGFDVENYHNLTIQDTIDTVGQALLGLSLGCARCHDHKYDPVNTADYYAWYGIFESTRYSFPGSEQKKRPYDSFPVLPPGEAERVKGEFEAELASLETRIKELMAEQTALANAGGWKGLVDRRRLKMADANRDGHQGFQVWRTEPLPIIGFNTSNETLKVPGTVPPGKLVVHPQQKDGVGVAWRSPLTGKVRIAGSVQDAHDCGDSVAWFIDRLSQEGMQSVAAGATERNGLQVFGAAADQHLAEVAVQAGDFVQFAIMPKANYGCDLTQIELIIEEADGDRRWNLVEDVSRDFLQGNPQPDRYGNAEVWYFYQVAEDRGEAFGRSTAVKLAGLDQAEIEARTAIVGQELLELTSRRDVLKKSGPYELVYGAIDKADPKNARIQLRGDKRKLGDEVPRKNLEILGNDPLPAGAGSGRLQMADWLTREENPLLARVMVNRIWQHHFGRGLVGTENDFGVRGERPTHPELLDWLATRFEHNGYSIKSMHRVIMVSAAYQRSSDYDAHAAEVDPDAKLLWRFNRRRLSAEEIRDAMLFVSGNLDPTMGGEHPFPPVESWGFTQHAPYYGDYPTNRRSVYLMQQRLKRHPFLSLFDGADTNVSTARRSLTTVPTQALYLMNAEFVHQQAEGLADRVLAVSNDTNARIDAAYRIALGRSPREDERADASRFLAAYREAIAETELPEDARELAALSGFVRTLLTCNEFLFVD